MTNWSVNASWFDLVALTLLAVGAWRGQRRGFSEEVLPIVQWACILGLGAVLSPPLARLLSATGRIGAQTATFLLYLLLAISLKVLFGMVDRYLSGRHTVLLHSAKTERPLGLLAGMARYAAMVLFCLAIASGIDTRAARQRLASGQAPDDADTLFLTMVVSLQRSLLEDCATGTWVRRSLPSLLLTPRELRAPGRP